MIGRQRLLVENVERGRGKLARVERSQQIGIDHMPATGDVDEMRRLGKLRQKLCIDDTARVRRQRQQANQHVGAGQERLQTIRTGKAFDTVDVLGAPRPAAHGKAKTHMIGCDPSADGAEAHDADALRISDLAELGIGAGLLADLGAEQYASHAVEWSGF